MTHKPGAKKEKRSESRVFHAEENWHGEGENWRRRERTRKIANENLHRPERRPQGQRSGVVSFTLRVARTASLYPPLRHAMAKFSPLGKLPSGPLLYRLPYATVGAAHSGRSIEGYLSYSAWWPATACA